MNINEEIMANLRSITSERRLEITRTEFNELYGFKSIPVIFKNAFQNLPIKEKWTKEYLIENLPDKQLLTNSFDPEQRFSMSLSEYINFNDPAYYYKYTIAVNSPLNKDFHVPRLFNCWYVQSHQEKQQTSLTWLYVGVKDSFSELHRDIWWTSAWNYLISGTKLWLIYPPVYNKQIQDNKDSFSLYRTWDNLLSVVNGAIKPMICVQNAGDLVYVPGNCYHSVINIEDSTSLTANFINETNYDRVREYFRKGQNPKNQVNVENIIKKGFENLLTENV